ncbi:MAG: PEP-CTERM sorting domain-containing protein [Rubrivivax sp.]|nr:PEP-CTERM sorting domain-containing protein [Rubrivivax sp.]
MLSNLLWCCLTSFDRESLMSCSALKGLGCAIALAAASSLISAAPLVSGFDAGAGGWLVDSSQGTQGVTDFAWNPAGGNPGGHLSARDIGDQGGWWFLSPLTWGGDWTGYLGGTIRFDVFSIAGQGTVMNPPVEAVVLVLEDGGRLRARGSAGAALDQWVSVEVPLVAESFNLTNSSYASFDEALGHVVRLVIPGDFVYRQNDVTRLDNVQVRAVPEPGTLSLLMAALLGCAAIRAPRRQCRSRRLR